MSSSEALISVLITGWGGLLGYHARSALFAQNCALSFSGESKKYAVALAPRLEQGNIDSLSTMLANADLVLHLAGINRANPEVVEGGNIELAHLLVSALAKSKSKAHVIYANSTHSGLDTHYGRGKGGADMHLSKWAENTGNRYSNIILPHIFGEKGKPFYNTVTATLCQQVVEGVQPTINDGAEVELLHAGAAVDAMLEAYDSNETGTKRLAGEQISVSGLHALIQSFKELYDANQYPHLSSKLNESLFNVYRWFEYPNSFPRELQLHKDSRGTLFEAVKGGGGGQTFLSWTEPGVERGNHFHRYKVERFLVVSGQADIKIRELFCDEVETFSVSGETPQVVDMPTLHTHSIINTGNEPLLTMFWAHEVFNPELPDTYAHAVTQEQES